MKALMDKKSETYRIQSIDRAADLLNAIARYSAPVRLKVLSAETGLHISTAYRILSALALNQFVERDTGGVTV